MFKTYTSVEYTLRGPARYALAKEQPISACRLTNDTEVYGFSDIEATVYGGSYGLRYCVNVLPTQSIQTQVPCTTVVHSDTDSILVIANVPIKSALGNYLPSPSTVVYLDIANNIVYTPEGYKVGCIVAVGSPILEFSNQQCTSALYTHIYNTIVSTPLFKHTTLLLQTPSTFNYTGELLSIPTTGISHRPNIPQSLIEQGCPTDWTIYPPKVLIKSKGKYYTYTTDWTEVSPPITVNTVVTQGVWYNALNNTIPIPDEMYQTQECNAYLQEIHIKYVEVISVGWVFRVCTTTDFWRETYPTEYLIWPKHNGAYWVFLCGELQ